MHSFYFELIKKLSFFNLKTTTHPDHVQRPLQLPRWHLQGSVLPFWFRHKKRGRNYKSPSAAGMVGAVRSSSPTSSCLRKPEKRELTQVFQDVWISLAAREQASFQTLTYRRCSSAAKLGTRSLDQNLTGKLKKTGQVCRAVRCCSRGLLLLYHFGRTEQIAPQ